MNRPSDDNGLGVLTPSGDAQALTGGLLVEVTQQVAAEPGQDQGS